MQARLPWEALCKGGRRSAREALHFCGFTGPYVSGRESLREALLVKPATAGGGAGGDGGDHRELELLGAAGVGGGLRVHGRGGHRARRTLLQVTRGCLAYTGSEKSPHTLFGVYLLSVGIVPAALFFRFLSHTHSLRPSLRHAPSCVSSALSSCGVLEIRL